MKDKRYLKVKSEIVNTIISTDGKEIAVEQSVEVHNLTSQELCRLLVIIIEECSKKSPLPELFIMELVTNLWKRL